MNLPAGIVTFLFTDVEGSTKLWEQYPEPMRHAMVRHDALAAAIIDRHEGTLVKGRGEGDSLFAVFARATDAVTAAYALQQAFVSESWPEGLSLRVRIALHTGEADLREGDYYGSVVNRCARLRALAHGGQILLSAATQELVRDYLPEGVHLQDMGEQRLRDFTRPEHVFQLLHAGLPADFPSLKSLDVLPNNLPVQLTSFIGREKEMAEIKRLLADARLLTLTGAGGCGKTRLSLQVGADVLEQFEDGVWFVDLAPLSDPALVPQAVASALSVREEPGLPLTQTLPEYLKAKHLLLILDNCEHLLMACATLADTLLHACPHLHLLASSREGLGITGETTYYVPSLSLPDLKKGLPSLESLSQYEAVTLFVARARAAVPAFTVTNQNAPAVAQICFQLDGIPLAIELAAVRVKGLSVEQINSRLSDVLRLLTGGSRTALPRHQTLRATIDWSYHLLTEPERILLRRLSVFTGGWSIEAAESVCSGKPISEGEVLDLLLALVDKSLVVVDTAEDSPRYHLLETIRQYGQERSEESGEELELRRLHRDYFLSLAEDAESQLIGPEQGVWLERLEAEHDNLRAALEWSMKSKDEGGRMKDESELIHPSSFHLHPSAEVVLQFAGAMGRFWQMRGYLSEGRAYLAAALGQAEAGRRTTARAKALDQAGVLALNQSDYRAAKPLLEQSLAMFRELGDKQGISVSLMSLGNVAYRQDDYGVAKTLLEESLAIKRELGDKYGLANVLHGLGNVAYCQGDYGTGRALHEQSLAIRRKLGDKRGIAYSLHSLGSAALNQGDYSLGKALHEESLAIKQELGDKLGIAGSLHNLGNLACTQGDFGTGRVLYEQSLTIRRELGDKWGIAASLYSLGLVAKEQGDNGTAKMLHEQSLAIRRELGDNRDIIQSVYIFGNIAQDQGDYGKARTLYEESLAIARECRDKEHMAYSLEAFARLAVKEDHLERAVRLWGAAEALREAISSPLPPNEREEYKRNLADLREALGKETFAETWEEGREMTLEQAIEYALTDE